MRRKPGQFGPSPRNPKPRCGGSRVSGTDPEREEPEPLSDPRQITARTIYRTPPKTSSAPSPMTIIVVSRFIAETRRPRDDAATEPGFKPERLDSFLRNEPGFPKLRRVCGKGECDGQDPNHRCDAGRGSALSLRAARAPAAHRQASEHRPGPRDLEYEATAGPSTRSSDEHCDNRKRQSQPVTKKIRYRQRMRFQRTRRTIRNSRVLKYSRLTYQVRAGGKAPGSTDCSSVTPPSSSIR